MPKRKRGSHGAADDDPAVKLEQKKRDVEKKLFHGKTVLGRALKNAEKLQYLKLRQKLKVAGQDHNGAETVKIQKELDVLKSLDLKLAVDAHLHKTLLKSKKWVESGLLPVTVEQGITKIGGSEEDLVIISNVTSRLWATQTVKDAMTQVLDSLYKIAELENPTIKSKKAEKPVTKKQDTEIPHELSVYVTAGSPEEESVTLENDMSQDGGDDPELSWEGFDDEEDEDKDSISGAESEDLSRYDNLIGNSSDEDSLPDDQSDDGIRRPSNSRITSARDLSISGSESEDSAAISPPPKQAKSSKPKKPVTPSKPGSKFLPTLMGGYWSGSEESATDDEDVAPPPQKKRMGQRDRRALAERKFGAKANHLKNQKLSSKDWDPKRGARGEGDRGRGRGGGRGGTRGGRGGRDGFARSREQVTGENATEIKPRGRGQGRKEDAGVIHPSWVAKKKAKEAQKTATFQGKKVVFD